MLELRWPQQRIYGKWIGGIGPFFRRHVESSRAYFTANEHVIALEVFGPNERLGEAEIPATLSNLIAIRDVTAGAIASLEEKAELILLALISDQPGLSAFHRDFSRIAQERFSLIDLIEEEGLLAAQDRLRRGGFLESRAEWTKGKRPLSSFCFVTPAGTARLKDSKVKLPRRPVAVK